MLHMDRQEIARTVNNDDTTVSQALLVRGLEINKTLREERGKGGGLVEANDAVV